MTEPEKKQHEQENRVRSAAEVRKASYFVLTIAAIFVINAMETGSYRTPWSVAIVVTLAGLGLLAYSLVKAGRENSKH
jgi:archaellum biogenesis protein FlaJ (TadC family)